MNRTDKAANPIPTPPRGQRSLWIILEAPEVIELKRIAIDRDGNGALTFFRDAVAPRVRAAAQQRGLALDLLTGGKNAEEKNAEEKKAEEKNHERIPG